MADHFKPEKYVDRLSMKKHCESAKSLDRLLNLANALLNDLSKKHPNDKPASLLCRAITLAKQRLEELDKKNKQSAK